MTCRLAMLAFAAVAAGCEARSPAAVSPSVTPFIASSTATATATPWRPVFVDLEGRQHRPFDHQATKFVALVFILPDCPIANSFLPELNRVHNDYANRGVELLLVHADPAVTAAEAREHADEYDVKPKVILDADHAMVKRAGATKTPEAAVFSDAGTLLYRGRINDQYAALGQRRAQVTLHDLRDALDALLAGRTTPLPFTEAVGCHIPADSSQELRQ